MMRELPPDRMVNAPPFTPKNASDSTMTHTSAWMRRRLVSNATLSRMTVKTLMAHTYFSVASGSGESATAVVTVIAAMNSSIIVVTPVIGSRFGSCASRQPVTVATKVSIAHGTWLANPQAS